jgi:phosphoheptose isomerase
VSNPFEAATFARVNRAISRTACPTLMEGNMDRVQSYVDEMHLTLDQLPLDLVNDLIEILFDARMSGRQVFIMGNGGSAATASHFVCDTCPRTLVLKAGLPSG